MSVGSYVRFRSRSRHRSPIGSSRWGCRCSGPLLLSVFSSASCGRGRCASCEAYVGRTTYRSRITMVQRRSAGGDPEGPGDSFRTRVFPARVEGCPLCDRPRKGRKMPHSPALAQAPAQAPASPLASPADHRSSSVLAVLCSCFPEGLPEGAGGRPGNDGLPHCEDGSTDGEIADSPRHKTPLVLPSEGRDAGARGSPNLREQGLSCEGEDPSCSPL